MIDTGHDDSSPPLESLLNKFSGNPVFFPPKKRKEKIAFNIQCAVTSLSYSFQKIHATFIQYILSPSFNLSQ